MSNDDSHTWLESVFGARVAATHRASEGPRG